MTHDTLAWRERAACRGRPTAWWFPAATWPGIYDLARSVCIDCEVRSDCLEYAMAVETQAERAGCWGGLNPAERRELARRRQRGAA